MKKILSIILALVMVCSLTVTAFAEENSTTLRFITPHIFSITGFETPLDGDTPCDSNSISVSADYDVSFEIYDAYWLHKTAESAWESVAGNFVAGETYSFLIMVSVDSWTFDTDPIVYINGDESLVDPSSFSYNDYKNVVTFQTIEMTVEEVNTPSYTFHCPSEVTLEYGNTEKQNIGDLYVTDVDGLEIIWCAPQYTDLINTADSTDTISLTLWGSLAGGREIMKNGQYTTNNAPQLYWANYYTDGWNNGYMTHTLSAQVSDWSGATPGATYQATITYVVTTR